MKSDLSWREEYNVGHSEIDEEHKLFLKTIQKIEDAFVAKVENEYLGRLFEELHKYAQFHFISEENIMIDNDYPNMEEHRAEHIALMNKLGTILIAFDPRLVDSRKLVDFLVDWFKGHTAHSDQKLAHFLANRHIG